jgi:hypothetical protein
MQPLTASKALQYPTSFTPDERAAFRKRIRNFRGIEDVGTEPAALAPEPSS